MKHRKSTPKMAQLVMRDDAEIDELVRAIDLLATDHLYEFEPRFAQLLEHEDVGVRSQALDALLVWWEKDEYLEVAFNWIAEGAENAYWAADALHRFLEYTGRHREPILRALARVVERTTDDMDAPDIYRCFLRALGREDLAKQVGPDWERDRDIDWDLLQPYLAS